MRRGTGALGSSAEEEREGEGEHDERGEREEALFEVEMEDSGLADWEGVGSWLSEELGEGGVALAQAEVVVNHKINAHSPNSVLALPLPRAAHARLRLRLARGAARGHQAAGRSGRASQTARSLVHTQLHDQFEGLLEKIRNYDPGHYEEAQALVQETGQLVEQLHDKFKL